MLDDEVVTTDRGGYKYRYKMRDGEVIEVGPFATRDAAVAALKDTHDTVRGVLLDARTQAGCDVW